MRVLLVSSNQERRPYPVAPLGICLLAERLRERHEVKVFDGMFEDPSSLRATVEAFEPDAVGLGVRNIEDPVMERHRSYLDDVLHSFVRPIRASTSAPLVLGGSGFSLFPDQMLARFEADFGLVGEAEQSLPNLIDDLESGARTARDGAQALESESIDVGLGELEIGPSKIERWIDFSSYQARSTYPVQTKRGCARRCIYCNYPSIEGSTFRLRSPDAIVAEIAEVSERFDGAVTFEIVDSVFNAPPGHAEAICRALIARNLGVKLRAMGINPKGLTTELLSLMQRAGFVQIHCSPDTASPAMLSRMGKGFSREALEAAAINIREAGMPTMWFMLIGGPGETEETFRETLDFTDRFVDPVDMVDFWAGLRIYPRTDLHARSVGEGVVDRDDDLFEPRYYVSAELGRARCKQLIEEACVSRPNCVPAWDAAPDPQMLREAFALRKKLQAQEPMFRTLIRLRRERMSDRAHL